MRRAPNHPTLRTLGRLTALAGLASLAVSASSCSHKSDEPTGTGFSSLVFVKRQHTIVNGDGTVAIDVAGGSNQVIDYLRYVPGGGVYLLSPPRPDGDLVNLTEQFTTADIGGIDLSFDAQSVVFSMKRDASDHYHVYTLNLATREIHQKTLGDWDDINPIYAPGGRIVFVTNQMYTEMGTRADEYQHGRVVTQLATITEEGGDADRKLCSQSLSHTVNPFLRFDGSIGYSRWEHLGGVNDVKLFRMAPDCTQMIHVAGQFGKPSNSIVQATEISPNVMLGIATNRERTIQSGAIVRVDARKAKSDSDPESLRLDSENVAFDVLTPGVPTGDEPSPIGRYRNPRVIPDGRVIASWADGVVNDTNELSATPPDFGIYLYDAETRQNQLVYNDKSTYDLYALPVVARAEPPVIGSVQNTVDSTKPSTFGSIDVKVTDLNAGANDDRVETVQHYSADPTKTVSVKLVDALPGTAKVRVIEGFSSEAAKGVTMFGLTMDEGAAILGEATVQKDGSWLANVPPYVPIHLQPVDKFGMSLRNQRLWIQGMPGEARVCGGCHESRTGNNTPGAGQNITAAAALGPENFVKPVAARDEYPWDGASDPTDAAAHAIQPLLTAKCAGCHNDTQNGSKAQTFYTLTKTDVATGTSSDYRVPYLSFSDTPTTVYYDKKVHTWPASYVSIFYPSTLGMMMGATKVVGDVPPPWGVPESARESVLIEKVNVRSTVAGDDSWAWDPATHPPHPEDVGGPALTDAERQALVRVMDLGGQYYSRKNTGFVPAQTDPTAGTKY